MRLTGLSSSLHGVVSRSPHSFNYFEPAAAIAAQEVRTKMNNSIRSLLGFLLLFASTTAGAAAVSYQATEIGAGIWQYEYGLTNDAGPTGVSELTIFFDLGLYSDLSVVASPDGWDSIVVQPDALIPDDGYLDTLALGSPLLLFQSVTGFVVEFTWLGDGSPGAQRFQIVDPDTFDALESGVTTVIPLPASLWLLGSALGLLGGLGRNPAPSRTSADRSRLAA